MEWSVNGVTLGVEDRVLGRSDNAMADGSLDSQVGARICNIMRACLETATLERPEGRLDQLEGAPPIYGNAQQDWTTYRTH